MHLMINMHLTTTVTKDVGLNGTLNENAFVSMIHNYLEIHMNVSLYLLISGLSHKTNTLKRKKQK